jgi:AcrR family transcriptional regulator
MSPRPRKVTDDELFAATHAMMNRVGPGELTLASIAKQAGVTAAVVVQRFGSKRNLLLALAERFSNEGGQMMAALRQANPTPLATLRAYAACMAGMATSPAAFARSLAYLQIDLTDPDFRKPLAKQAHATRRELQKLIEEAIDEGELIRVERPAGLARTLEAILGGSLLTWAFYREGTSAHWLQTDLEAVLAPYLPPRKARRSR